MQNSFTQAIPSGQENPFFRRSRLVNGRSIGRFDSGGHFGRSLQPSQSSPGISPTSLIKFSNTRLFGKAIDIISSGILAMPWTISPEEQNQVDPKSIEMVKRITNTMKRPNRGHHDSYRIMVRALIRDLLIFNVCVLERQPSISDKPDTPLFWLWDVSAQDIEINPAWNPTREGITPRFWFAPKDGEGKYLLYQDQWKPLYDKNIIYIIHRAATHEEIPMSPVEAAYEDVCVWLGLRGYQNSVTSKIERKFMISLEDAGESELEHFREYWNTYVVGSGEIPIIGGKVDVINLGPTKDDELFLKFSDYLAGIIALEFGLSKVDFGIDPHDNRATRKTVADLSFQQAVLPIAQTLMEALNEKVVKFYCPGYVIELSDTEPRNEGEEAGTAKDLYAAMVITKNEARKRVGEKPLDKGGDEFAQPSAPQQPIPGQPASEKPIPEQPMPGKVKVVPKQLELFPPDKYALQNPNDQQKKGRLSKR